MGEDNYLDQYYEDQFELPIADDPWDIPSNDMCPHGCNPFEFCEDCDVFGEPLFDDLTLEDELYIEEAKIRGFS